MRRPVAWVAAIVLFVEAIGIALLNWFLGVVVDRQDMSLAGLDSDMMSVSSKVGGWSSASTSRCAASPRCSLRCATAPRASSAASC